MNEVIKTFIQITITQLGCKCTYRHYTYKIHKIWHNIYERLLYLDTLQANGLIFKQERIDNKLICFRYLPS